MKSISSKSPAAVTAACRALESAEIAPDLSTLAAQARLSPFQFHRVFKKTTGLTPKAYALAHRAKRLRAELPARPTVTEAMYGAGFNSSSRFYTHSQKMLGMKPAHYRKGGTGETLRFAIGQSSLGAILVAASANGVSAIFLGNDPDQLAQELQNRFPRAQIVGADRAFEKWVAQVVGFVETPKVGWDLPLDIRGTAFQQRVWNALRKIPQGSTATYAQIAHRIGSPKSVRAVASACAANNLALSIPCHREIRTDGSLSGYRWGVTRKRTLLDREAAKSK